MIYCGFLQECGLQGPHLEAQGLSPAELTAMTSGGVNTSPFLTLLYVT